MNELSKKKLDMISKDFSDDFSDSKINAEFEHYLYNLLYGLRDKTLVYTSDIEESIALFCRQNPLFAMFYPLKSVIVNNGSLIVTSGLAKNLKSSKLTLRFKLINGKYTVIGIMLHSFDEFELDQLFFLGSIRSYIGHEYYDMKYMSVLVNTLVPLIEMYL